VLAYYALSGPFYHLFQFNLDITGKFIAPNGAKYVSDGQRPSDTDRKCIAPNGAKYVSDGQRPSDADRKCIASNGAKYISDGQRPSDIAIKMGSPERAVYG